MSFNFWRLMPDGTVEATTDEDAVNSGEGRFFGSIEGAIINGGVRATAFRRYTEILYDAEAFFTNGTMIAVDEITTTKITAERE